MSTDKIVNEVVEAKSTVIPLYKRSTGDLATDQELTRKGLSEETILTEWEVISVSEAKRLFPMNRSNRRREMYMKRVKENTKNVFT